MAVEGSRGPRRAAAWICTIGNNPGDPAVFSTVLDGNKFVFGDKLADARLIAAAPEMAKALDAIAGPELFNIAVNGVEVSPERMRALLGEIYELARIAANNAEGSDMDAPSIDPSLHDLRRSLDHAETELACADMIDNQARRVAETERCRRRRDDLKAQIARIEETF
jgi:hypothetical protein